MPQEFYPIYPSKDKIMLIQTRLCKILISLSAYFWFTYFPQSRKKVSLIIALLLSIWGFGVCFLEGERTFSLHSMQTNSGAHQASCLIYTERSFPWGKDKWQGQEWWSYFSSLICLHGKELNKAQGKLNLSFLLPNITWQEN